MTLLGVHLTVLAGPTVPVPLPPDVTARVRELVVTESDSDRSAFTLTLDAGRSGPTAALDTSVLTTSPVRANSRVVVVLTMGAVPIVLADGIVTETELVPGGPGQPAELRATGHDLSVLLDRHEVSAEHVGLDDMLQVGAIAAPYLAQGVVPQVVPPPALDPPLPIERIPTQQGTDWEHLEVLAAHHGFVVTMVPGPAPGTSTLYWGPPVRIGVPQPALSVDLGAHTNVTGSPRFRQDVLGPELLEGQVQDPRLGAVVPVRTVGSLRPPLAALPVWAVHQPDVRTRQVRDSGVPATTALARAQAGTDASIDCVEATGSLDGGRYGSVLRPRGLVGMRGAGWSHDGLWYVRKVEHRIARGSYTADFTLVREGFGSTVPVVRV
ncbi:hypothetical protein IF650_19025 [Cellulosimicrobium terreum]|nr:hypothetical protein [Cellulosimicrobium terreum]